MERDADDRALVKRILGGDEEAFEEFFRSYFNGLYRFALARLRGDAPAAEEVAQAALCRAVARLETWRGEAALFTWLCTFCRHEIAAHLARRGGGREVELVEDAPEIRAALESLSARDASLEMERRELKRLVQATLDALPPRYGDALEWKYIQGLSVAEIAKRLELGQKAAESLLTRAREAFRDGFAAYGLVPGLSKE